MKNIHHYILQIRESFQALMASTSRDWDDFLDDARKFYEKALRVEIDAPDEGSLFGFVATFSPRRPIEGKCGRAAYPSGFV